MNIKKNGGFVATDIVLAIIGIFMFSTLIVSLMHNNSLENLKLKKEALATIYLTEALENIGIANYEQVTEENTDIFIPGDIENNGYDMDITITEDDNEGITKKITTTISYNIGDKEYTKVIDRTKIKE